MAEEYTCIECENLYDDSDGDTDERMCRECLDRIYVERLKDWNEEINGNRDNNKFGGDSGIDADYEQSLADYAYEHDQINEMNDAIKLTPEYKLGKKLLNNEISNLTTKNIIDNDRKEGTDVE